MNYAHIPVLLREAIDDLAPARGGRFLDGTIGLGGHAGALLEASPSLELCGLDRDGWAVAEARQRLQRFGSRARIFHLPFAEFPKALNELGWTRLDGALLDLGVSSPQLDDPERGFSFQRSGPLDMRMNQRGGASARDFVNGAAWEELRDCIATLGEDPQASRIASAIIKAREARMITEAGVLAEIVRQAYPPAWRAAARKDPATRTFQAIRMRVNDELGQLSLFLEQILHWLAPGARLAIISFHSLEDRMVKNAFRNWATGCLCGIGARICSCGHVPEARIIHRKPVVAGVAERGANPRATSAKLRAVEKLGAGKDDHPESAKA